MVAFVGPGDSPAALETRALALRGEAVARRVQAADAALVAGLLLFLAASYLYCVCAKWLAARRISAHGRKQRGRGLLSEDMEQPLLGPPDYEQPPVFDRAPPAYEFLPSAPPLSP